MAEFSFSKFLLIRNFIEAWINLINWKSKIRKRSRWPGTSVFKFIPINCQLLSLPHASCLLRRKRFGVKVGEEKAHLSSRLIMMIIIIIKIIIIIIITIIIIIIIIIIIVIIIIPYINQTPMSVCVCVCVCLFVLKLLLGK